MMYISPKFEPEEASLNLSKTASDGYQGQEKESEMFNKNV